MYRGFILLTCSFNFDDNKAVYIASIYHVYIWMHFYRKGYNWYIKRYLSITVTQQQGDTGSLQRHIKDFFMQNISMYNNTS